MIQVLCCTKMYALFLLALQLFPCTVFGHCWGIGDNPSFFEVPKVSQISSSMVRVSWDKVVEKRHCADNFYVKFWPAGQPSKKHHSKVVHSSVNHVDLRVLPNVLYVFQVVAREVKKALGYVWDTDDNHSNTVTFQITFTPPPPPPPPTTTTTTTATTSTIPTTKTPLLRLLLPQKGSASIMSLCTNHTFTKIL